MPRMVFSTSALLLFVLVSPLWGQSIDRVRKVGGGSASGTIARVSPTEIVVREGTGTEATIPVTEIDSVVFADEPHELSQARLHAGNGQFEEALSVLGGIDDRQIKRDLVKQDLAFYRALCKTRLALDGRAPVAEAGKAMLRFVNTDEYRNSFHYLQATRLVGDLLVASGKYTAAEPYYRSLVESSLNEYQLIGRVLGGQALAAQGKCAEAIAMFDEVLASEGDGFIANQQRMEARLGKAVCLAETGKIDEGIALVGEVLATADAGDSGLNARAYRARGLCQLKAGRKEDALLDFLHVDLLYSSVPEIHAEALYHLTKLWPTVGQPERAQEAAESLKQRYPHSRWATNQ